MQPFPFASPPLDPQSPMSNKAQGKTQNPNWGGARQGAGRPKKTLTRTCMQLQNADLDSQPAPVPSASRSATHRDRQRGRAAGDLCPNIYSFYLLFDHAFTTGYFGLMGPRNRPETPCVHHPSLNSWIVLGGTDCSVNGGTLFRRGLAQQAGHIGWDFLGSFGIGVYEYIRGRLGGGARWREAGHGGWGEQGRGGRGRSIAWRALWCGGEGRAGPGWGYARAAGQGVRVASCAWERECGPGVRGWRQGLPGWCSDGGVQWMGDVQDLGRCRERGDGGSRGGAGTAVALRGGSCGVVGRDGPGRGGGARGRRDRGMEAGMDSVFAGMVRRWWCAVDGRCAGSGQMPGACGHIGAWCSAGGCAVDEISARYGAAWGTVWGAVHEAGTGARYRAVIGYGWCGGRECAAEVAEPRDTALQHRIIPET
ncbi:hypothetical protein C8J57DRAFT_1253600 [Mycena rebaudengoi]|nr:hypothetical protein C8J57DRAFT_1253600 [Mycena rebaudengoi]